MQVNERKKEVQHTKSQISQLAKKLGDDYTELSTQVQESQLILKEIQEMEEELTQLLDDENESQQVQIPLPDMIAIAEDHEMEESKLASEISNNRTMITESTRQLEILQTQERRLNLKKLQVEAMAQDALRVRASENQHSRHRKEELGRWYRSMIDLMQRKLSIKSFEILTDKEEIDIVLETKTKPVAIQVFFRGTNFVDAKVPIGFDIDEIVQEARSRNDVAYAINQIRISADSRLP
ncbi:hypothetical protein NEOLI_002469 [Neolecta irregularis DAH-3]|uniref:Kinetochore protein SPC25 n=1 Tax=Neolecta irregularis (strain DAH-3) TaxID=1198029 RepID=A0A1U7LJ43_NEOID|nr:hypothetical protein NEOLI_002469 [Neolecta irregularis DAH-3]|eukprot:OLL22664.1 hypothetical protein NEOLI_002469 [Neolecta irregularis DAH-3]